MKIEYIKARNFMCFGDEPLEIDFTKLGNVVLIEGRNLDFHDDENVDFSDSGNEYHSNASGKCFGKGTEILMFDGSIKKVEDVQVGDLVMGHDSTPRKVLNLARGKEQLYKVVPKKGDSYIVNESHILTLKTKDKKYNKFKSDQSDLVFNISVRDYLKQSNSFKYLMGGYRASVEFSKQEVKIPPYVLGIWLGDGISNTPEITTITHNCNIFHNNKHIPDCYKFNSRQMRLELLAGILDSDGCLSNGLFEFVNKSKRLAEDVLFLARSLGFAANIKECKQSSQNGKIGTYYRINISGDTVTIPTKIPRKQTKRSYSQQDVLTVGIKLESLGIGEYYGFQLEGNPLFLLADFTVVHNSSVSESISYALYGSTIRKHVTHTDAINNTNKKKLEVEVIFKIGKNRYRIIRTRKPDSLRIWQDGPPWIDAPADNSNEITRGGQPSTQKYIEESVLGMNHKAFVNVTYFGQHNEYNFLDCTPAEQRQIAESLLSLEVFKEYCLVAKDNVKELKDNLKEKTAVYNQVLSHENELNNRIKQLKNKITEWKTETQLAIKNAEIQKSKLELELSQSDIGQALLEYEKSQSEIIKLKDQLPARLEQEVSLERAVGQAKEQCNKIKEKLHTLQLDYSSIEQDIKLLLKDKIKIQEELNKLERLPEGAKCPHCYGKIEKQHYKHVVTHYNNKLSALEPKHNVLQSKLERNILDTKKFKQSIQQLESLKETAQSKLNKTINDINTIKHRLSELSKITRPDLNSKELVLQEKVSQIDQFIIQKLQQLEDDGPYNEILSSVEDDLNKLQNDKQEKKIEIDDITKQLPYYQWWSKGFDDIRSFVIEKIVPSLNAKIAIWMQYLFNGKLNVTFDKHLNVTIESNDNLEYKYFNTCGGERRRINLAVSQAFSYIMILSSQQMQQPSVCFLDEISDSIDQRGIKNIYDMICELASEKQVFVITHNIKLREMLDGADTIKMLRKNGVSKLIS